MQSSDTPIEINREIVKFIDSGASFAVATVLWATSSSPQKAAVMAIIEESGRIWGTVGGGLVEAKAIEFAPESCRSGQPLIFNMDLADPYSREAHALCGGEMRILIDPTMQKDRESYEQAAKALEQRKQGVLLTQICAKSTLETSVKWFSGEAGLSQVSPVHAERILECLKNETPLHFEEESGSGEILIAPIIPRPLLVIAGGGHIGQALAKQALLVGFDVTVVDDRPEFSDPALFPPETTVKCGSMPETVGALNTGDKTYIVIVTRGHKADAETLEACIHSDAAYIGMIGSTRKVSLIRENFIETGLSTEEEFDRVFAPIGLDISAVTVPEIATSITAQLVAVRRANGTKTQ